MTQYTLTTYRFSQLSRHQLLQMSKLRRPNGGLWQVVQCIESWSRWKSNLPPEALFNRFVIAETKGGKVLGWALLVKKQRRCDLMLYVRRSHRRQGIGTRLVKRAERLYNRHQDAQGLGDLTVYRHEDQGNFFETVGYATEANRNGSDARRKTR